MTVTTDIRDKKLAERDRLLAEAEATLGTHAEHLEDDDILATGAEHIVAGIKAGRWTSEAVVSAFIRSACDAQKKTNCITEVLFKEALADAKAKDAAVAAGEKPEGEFFGLPCSFKDTNNIVGVDTSLGCSPYCFKPTEKPEDEASLVKIFRSQGGIPICKTGIPQTLLAFECSNPIFGTTSNPYSSARTCGGSSGGEAALITLRGTPLGWGSDIGGSLRIPAAYSGCCGLKPAVGRWPAGGNRPTVKGFDGIKAVVGPMARTVDELTFAARVAIQSTQKGLEEKLFQGDNVVPLPWREANLPSKLKIGYWTDDSFVKASPANVRAMNETVEALRKLGHELVEFPAPDAAQALAIFSSLSSSDGYKQLLAHLGPDPMEPSMSLVTLGSRIPVWLLWVASTFIKYGLKDPIFGDILYQSRAKSASEYMYWSGQRDDYIRAFRKNAWEEHGLDFVLCPPQAVPALEHGRTKELSPLCIGTALFNVIDATVGVLPITRVDAERDAAPADYVQGYPGSHILNNRVYTGADPAYDATKMAGLPVGVQIVGRTFDDEKVLAMMKIVETAVGYK